MALALYRFVWPVEVEKKLASGTAIPMLDRSGLLLAMGKSPRTLVGLPRLVPVRPHGIGGLVGALVGSANLLAAGHDALYERRAQRAAGASRGEADSARELLIEGGVAHSESRRAAVESARQRGASRLDPLSQNLARSTLETLALLSHARDLDALGFAAVALDIDSGLPAPKQDLDELRATVRDECERVVDPELRKAAYLVVDAEDGVGRFERQKEGGADLRALIHGLTNAAIPLLRARIQAGTRPGELVAITLLVIEAMRTMALARALLEDPAATGAAFQSGGLAARDGIRRLMDEPATAFEFFGVRLPGAKLLVASLHAMRIGELALQPEIQAAVASPIEPSAAARRAEVLSSDVLASPVEDDGPAARSRHFSLVLSSDLASRVAGADVPEGDHEIEATTLAGWAGMPPSFVPSEGFTEEELAIAGPLLLKIADPANRSVEKRRILDAAGIHFVTEAERAQWRSNATTWLREVHRLELAADELAAFSDRALLGLEEAAQLTAAARASGVPVTPAIVRRESTDHREVWRELQTAHERLLQAAGERDQERAVASRARAALAAAHKGIESAKFALGIREKDAETRELLGELADRIAEDRRHLG